MTEVLKLKNMDEDLCMKLSMDPYYISGTTVPTTAQLDGLKDHIRRMEELKFDREEQFITMKETILSLYEELEEEPLSDMEREIACEDTERFTLSANNLTEVGNIQRMLQNQVKANQKQHLGMVEKIESLYERLRLDMAEKYKFLSLHQVIQFIIYFSPLSSSALSALLILLIIYFNLLFYWLFFTSVSSSYN